VTASDRSDLRADCERCVGLCCVAPAFAADADFAIDKPAGEACPNLRTDFRCEIHRTLRRDGFPGCTAYDCFGAGQRVSQHTFEGRDWRREPKLAKEMFDVFAIMRGLHELLWYLTEAIGLKQTGPLRAELGLALGKTERLCQGDPETLVNHDVASHRGEVSALLLRASEMVRGAARGQRTDLMGADLMGAQLECADFRAVNLGGARLIGADLRNADLRWADLIGADMRRADLAGANLTGSIFLTQSQIDSAKGGPDTKLPASITPPRHWRSPRR
jgi:uncharacterized protein YjbI with pentapeptide repeats